MKVLVTGGGGFLGSAVCSELLKRDHQVSSFSRHSYPQLISKGVNCIKGDLQNRTDLLVALEGQEAVIHCAALAGVWGDDKDFYKVNVRGTQQLISVMKELGVGHLVYTSSPSVVFAKDDLKGVDESIPYADHYYCTYAKTKAMAEQEVLAACDESFFALSLRPHLIWGPGDPHIIPRILAKARTGKLKRVGHGENLVDIIYVDNAAVAHVDALEKLTSDRRLSGEAFFIGQERPVKLWDFIGDILRAYDLDSELDTISYPLAYGVGYVMELIYRFLGIRKPEPPMTRFVAMQLGKEHYFSHDKAKSFFDYKVHVTIEQGLVELEQARQKEIVQKTFLEQETNPNR